MVFFTDRLEQDIVFEDDGYAEEDQRPPWFGRLLTLMTFLFFALALGAFFWVQAHAR